MFCPIMQIYIKHIVLYILIDIKSSIRIFVTCERIIIWLNVQEEGQGNFYVW